MLYIFDTSHDGVYPIAVSLQSIWLLEPLLGELASHQQVVQ